MVNLTIYIEGGLPDGLSDPAALTSNNNAVFREGFHKLFSQKLPESGFNLIIESIGPVSGARKQLEEINRKNLSAALLIDLDGPTEEKAQRLEDNYFPEETDKLFFMVQEMEAWILSQPEQIEQFAHNQGWKRKKADKKLEENTLLKSPHPEQINKPSEKLNTLFKQYFATEKIRKGKLKSKPANYHKTKNGPSLVGLLNAEKLSLTFEDFQALVEFIDTIITTENQN